MIERLNLIIGELQNLVYERQMSVPQQVVFEQACSFLRGELASKSRLTKTDIKNVVKTEVSNKPSEKQINALKKLGKYKEGITKQEAWRIIKETKEAY